LPCNQPSFIAGKYAATEHLLGPNPYDPTVGTKNMGAMAYLVRVVGIWGNILKQIHLSAFQTYSPEETGSKLGEEFEGFIGKLENWRKTLPRGLEYSNENLAGQISVGTTGAFVTMHVMWHTAMAYVHRYVRTVGIPKDFIEKNIPREVIIESIRKAFVHADAVLQIMVHVREQRSLAAKKGETVTVNAPFLGQAISDACNITVIRAKEVHGGPRGATEQRRRVRAGLEWLRELRRYWKPIESMYQKLKKKYRELERSASRQSSSTRGVGVPTPESVDSSLQPGSAYPVNPADYSAEPTFTSAGMAHTMNQDPAQFPQFVDFMSYSPSVGIFGEAFGADVSSYMLSEYARNEGGFPDLYIPYSEVHMNSVSASYDFIAPNPPMSAEMMQPMQLDPPAVPTPPPPPPHTGSFQADHSDSDDSDDDEDSGGDGEKTRGNINATYFDPTAVCDGALPDSASDSSGHSRRASGVGGAISLAKVDNPMDLLHLVNQDDINTGLISASLQGRQNENDQFTGPNGAAAPENNDLGGQPNLDNSGMSDPAAQRHPRG
jgi:hypothetical protein